MFKITAEGKLITLHRFASTDGAIPYAGLIQAINGDLYGTTYAGGSNCVSSGGCGTVFKITTAGKLRTLHSFCSQANCADGEYPYAGMVQGTDENFYGTTFLGGANGSGTVFKMSPSGTLTTLHSFDLADGENPAAALIQATDGDFYGTTAFGGANGYGTLFKITPTGDLTTLHNFDNVDGAVPLAGLVQATSGSFYGTTSAGGNINNCGMYNDICGTVFRISVGLSPFVKTQPTASKVGAAVMVLGTNLAGVTQVSFNGTVAKFTVVSKSEIKTAVPTGATTGTVTVKTPKGMLKSNLAFRVTKR